MTALSGMAAATLVLLHRMKLRMKLLLITLHVGILVHFGIDVETDDKTSLPLCTLTHRLTQIKIAQQK